MKDLSHSIFQEEDSDREAVKAYHASSSSAARNRLTPQELASKGRDYWLRHVRRYIRPHEQLKEKLHALQSKYTGPGGIDKVTGRSLLTDATVVVLDELQGMVQDGILAGKYPTRLFPYFTLAL
jgi:hypothetical protein